MTDNDAAILVRVSDAASALHDALSEAGNVGIECEVVVTSRPAPPVVGKVTETQRFYYDVKLGHCRRTQVLTIPSDDASAVVAVRWESAP